MQLRRQGPNRCIKYCFTCNACCQITPRVESNNFGERRTAVNLDEFSGIGYKPSGSYQNWDGGCNKQSGSHTRTHIL